MRRPSPPPGSPPLPRPRAAAPARRPHELRALVPAIAVEIVLLAGGYLAYAAVRSLAAGQEETALRHGLAVLHAEEGAHLSFERPVQVLVLPHRWLVGIFNACYVLLYGPFILATAAYLFVRDRARYVQMRRTLLISGAIGLLIFALFPVAPPRLLPGAGFRDTINLYLPRAGYSSDSAADQFAAIPSFHCGWTALAAFCLASASPSRVARSLLGSIPFVMLATVVVTGNHLWFDAAAGLLTVMVAYRLAALLPPLRPTAGRLLHAAGTSLPPMR